MKQKYFLNEINNSKNIRFIYQGELLKDNDKLSQYKIRNNSFIHVSIAIGYGIQSLPNFQNSLNNQNCDDPFDDAELARMLEEREIGAINIQNIDEMDNNNNINNINNNIGLPMNEETNSTDFACGLFLGLMLGMWVILVLVIMRRHRSRRFQLGIFLGLMFNLILEMLNNTNNTGISNTNANTNTNTNTDAK